VISLHDAQAALQVAEDRYGRGEAPYAVVAAACLRRDQAQLDAKLATKREAEAREAAAQADRDAARADQLRAEERAHPHAWIASILPEVQKLVALHQEARLVVDRMVVATEAQASAAQDARDAAAFLGSVSAADPKTMEDALLVTLCLQRLALADDPDAARANGWIALIDEPAWNARDRADFDSICELLEMMLAEPAADRAKLVRGCLDAKTIT
jgi:hypothetical protein